MAGMSDLATYVLAMARPKVAPRPRPVVAKLPPGGGKGGRSDSGPGSSGRRRSRTPPAVRAMRWLEQPGMQVGSQGEETAYLSVGLVDMEARTRLTRRLTRQLSLALQPNQPSEVHLSSLGFAKISDLALALNCTESALALIGRIARDGPNPMFELLEHNLVGWLRLAGGVRIAMVAAEDLSPRLWIREV